MTAITFHISKSKQECAEYFADEFIKDVSYYNAGAWRFGFSFTGRPDAWWYGWNGQPNVDIVIGAGTSHLCEMEGVVKGLPFGSTRRKTVNFFLRSMQNYSSDPDDYSVLSSVIFVFDSPDEEEKNLAATRLYSEMRNAGY